MGVGGGAGFRIESAEGLINIPAFRVEEDLGGRQLIARRNRGGILRAESRAGYIRGEYEALFLNPASVVLRNLTVTDR